MKDDQRVVLTKRLLQEGILRLLNKTELGKISVTQLCTESGINRATFYRHYEQPRDILNDLRRDMFQDVRALASVIEAEGDIRKWLEASCSYYYEHSDLLRVLFKYRTDDEFVIFLNEMLKEQYPELKRKGLIIGIDDDSMRLGAYYFAGGIYYILRQWITEPIKKTPPEVAALMCHFLNIS